MKLVILPGSLTLTVIKKISHHNKQQTVDRKPLHLSIFLICRLSGSGMQAPGKVEHQKILFRMLPIQLQRHDRKRLEV